MRAGVKVLATIALVLAGCGQPVPDQPAAPPTPAAAEPVAATIPDCADLEPPPPQVDGPTSGDPKIAAAQQARADVGLPSDIDTVEAIMATMSSPGPLTFPHTEAEFEEVMGRNAAGDSAGALRAWVDVEDVTAFAGMWLDQEAGGVFTVAFTGDLDRWRDEVRQRFNPAIRVVTAANTYAELEAIQDGMTARMQASFEGNGARIYGAGVREDLNRVALSVLGDATELRAELAREFGDETICLEVEPIPTEDDAEVAPWEPAPGADLSTSSTRIDVLLLETACAGGGTAVGRVAEPEIRYDSDAVIITLRVIPRGGVNTCPGNHETPYTVVLDEPLGDRALLDGGVDPPAPPDLHRPFAPE